jgi:general secretion pathway protein A
MFLTFYGLREQPFGVTPDPRFLYLSGTNGETLASQLYGIQSNLGFTALIGQPGLGKTTFLFHIMERFRNSAVTAFLFETQCNSTGLLKYFLQELGVESTDNDPVTMHRQIQQVLADAAVSGRRVILIVDEAQNLDASVLETIRLLSNFETKRSKLLHIILAGQPLLAKRLSQPELVQLEQRVALTGWLNPLPTDEVGRYVEHRLRAAGLKTASPFSEKAIEMIAMHSGGVPRKINRTCFNSLSIGYKSGKHEIDEGVVEEGICELGPQLQARQKVANLSPDPAANGTATHISVLPVAERRPEPADAFSDSATDAVSQQSLLTRTARKKAIVAVGGEIRVVAVAANDSVSESPEL